MRHRLRRRYGHTRERTRIMIVTARKILVNDAPGGHQGVLEEGDRVEVGGKAANDRYFVAYRVQKLGHGWERLGPFATVPVSAVKPR